MDYERFIRHAIEVVRQYRALWVLGFVWALVGGTGSGGAQGLQSTFSGSDPTGAKSVESFDGMGLDWASIASVAVPLVVLACGLVLALIVLTTVVRYVVMVGVMRCLDLLDRHGIEPTVRGGWNEGWHRRTVRPFLQSLVVGIPLGVAFVLLLVPVAAPLLLGLFSDGELLVAGAIAAGGLFCCWLLVVVVVSAIVGVLQELWVRAAVLDDVDFLKAMGVGWRLARANARDLVTAWFVMLVIGVLWFVATVLVAIAFGLVTAVAAGLPAFLLYEATASAVGSIVLGGSVAVVTFVLPMVFVQGLYLVFRASVWNQIYRALPVRDAAGLA